MYWCVCMGVYVGVNARVYLHLRAPVLGTVCISLQPSREAGLLLLSSEGCWSH